MGHRAGGLQRRTARRGATSPTTTPGRGPTGGARTGWRVHRHRAALCLGLALWNGRDPILKERIFGLTGPEGNHGEDVKEYWWYLDSMPTHAWKRWRYHYPQRGVPVQGLVAEKRAAASYEPEYELVDTGVFDDNRYWVVEVDYAKADPTDLLMTVEVTNRVRSGARCTCCRPCGSATTGPGSRRRRVGALGDR